MFVLLQRVKPIDKLGVGMMLEVIDKEDPKYYWVAIISEIYAGRLRLQYKGTEDSSGEIWCYYLSERLHEPGHGFVYGLTLRPPRGIFSGVKSCNLKCCNVRRMCLFHDMLHLLCLITENGLICNDLRIITIYRYRR